MHSLDTESQADDGQMEFSFTSFSTVFQSYWNAVCNRTQFTFAKNSAIDMTQSQYP